CVDGNACTLTDVCDAFGVCAGTDPANTITVDISIPHMAPAVSETRDVTFVITECNIPLSNPTTVITQAVSFDNTGFGTTVLTGVPSTAGYLSVRTGHTLSRLAPPILFDGCGDEFVDLTLAGSELISGDFQNAAGTALQDGLVDITDFSILASVYNTPAPANHNVGADATGDGMQATADFVAIQQGFLQVSNRPVPDRVQRRSVWRRHHAASADLPYSGPQPFVLDGPRGGPERRRLRGREGHS
ncbi:MAG: hypothetical protein ACE5E5_00480, partial [Phycisphaerae bacterium]